MEGGHGGEESMRINRVRRKEGQENGTRGEISWAVDMTTGWDRFQGQEKASPFPLACAPSHPFLYHRPDIAGVPNRVASIGLNTANTLRTTCAALPHLMCFSDAAGGEMVALRVSKCLQVHSAFLVRCRSTVFDGKEEEPVSEGLALFSNINNIIETRADQRYILTRDIFSP